MKKIFLITLAVLLVSAFVLGGCAEPAPTTPTPAPTTPTPAPTPAPEKITLRIQSAFPEGDIGGDALVYFADAAKKYSNGVFDIKTFSEPEIVGMFEAAGALTGGTLDMMQGNGILFGGRGVKVGDIEFGMPYGYLIPEKTTFEDKANEIRRFFFKDGFADLLRTEYAKQGVYWLDMSINGPVPFLAGTEKAADAFQGTPDDLKGLVIRTDGLFMEWQNALGMTGVDMGPSDAYTALQTGTVDVHQWDISAFMGMGYEEVAPYWIRGEENDHIVVSIYVNMKVWNSLSAELQDALAKAAEDYYYKTLELYGEAMDGLLAKIADGTVIEVQMSAANLARHREVAYQMWDEIAGRDEVSAQAVKLFKVWRGIK